MTDLPHSFLIAGDEIILPPLLYATNSVDDEFVTQKKRRKCKADILNDLTSSDEVLITRSINARCLARSVRRAGIIPYTISDSGDVIFALGIDQSGDYSDGGGGFSRKYDKLPIICATRELGEEFLGILDVTIANLANEPCIVADHIVVYFAYLSPERLFSLPSRFPKRLIEHNSHSKKKSEMIGIRLIFDRDIFDDLNQGNIYSVISGALSRNIDKVISIIKGNSIYKL